MFAVRSLWFGVVFSLSRSFSSVDGDLKMCVYSMVRGNVDRRMSVASRFACSS